MTLLLPFAAPAKVSDDEGPTPAFKRFGSFGLELQPTPEALVRLENSLIPVVEETLQIYLEQNTEAFQSVHIANIESVSLENEGRRRLEAPSTTVKFSGGVMMFGAEPTEDVSTLLEKGIQSGLVERLVAADEQFASISSASYISYDTPEEEEETTTTVGGAQIGRFVAKDDDSETKIGPVLGGVAALFLLIFAIFFFATRKRRSRSTVQAAQEKPSEDDLSTVAMDYPVPDIEQSVASGDASSMAHYAPGELLDSISVASEFTVTTNDDSKGTSARRRNTELMAAAESFDRDRNVTLQKDMLHCEWSLRTAKMASNEKKSRLSQSNTLSFEQAYDDSQGEEIYLAPPSTSRHSDGEDSI